MPAAKIQLTTGETLPLSVEAYDQSRKLLPEQTLRSACFAPFTNMDFDATGAVRLCNHAYTFAGNVADGTPLLDIWRGATFEKFRRDLSNYTFDASHCAACISQCRVKTSPPVYTFATEQFDEFATEDPHPAFPTRLIFRLGNTCNLACVMCDGQTSSRIRKERDQMPEPPSPYGEPFFEQMREIVPHLRYVEFYGGEPFLVPAHRKIFKLLQELNPDCRIFVNTNNTILTPEVDELYRTLNFTHVVVSMDAASPRTHGFVRKGINHAKFLANWRRLLELRDLKKFELLINLTEHRKNWYALPAVFNFAADHGVYLHVNVCTYPHNVTLYTLPVEEIRYVLNFLQRNRPRMGPYERNDKSFKVLTTHLETAMRQRAACIPVPIMTQVNQESDGLLATPWPGEPPFEQPEDIVRELPFMQSWLSSQCCQRMCHELIRRLEEYYDHNEWRSAINACYQLLQEFQQCQHLS